MEKEMKELVVGVYMEWKLWNKMKRIEDKICFGINTKRRKNL